jgi:hypothetical protein
MWLGGVELVVVMVGAKVLVVDEDVGAYATRDPIGVDVDLRMALWMFVSSLYLSSVRM